MRVEWHNAVTRVFVAASILAATMPVILPAAATHAEATSWTALVLDPDAGDWLTDGVPAVLAAPAAVITTDSGSATRFGVYSYTPTSWALSLTAPTGQTLVPGTTYQVENYPTAEHAGFQLSYRSRGCSAAGSVTLHDYAYDAGANLTTELAASFAVTCASPTGPVLYGEIRFASSRPWSAVDAPASVNVGSDRWGADPVVKPVTIHSVGTGALSLSNPTIHGPGASEYAIVGDDCTTGPVAEDASCTINVAFNTDPAIDPDSATLSLDADTARGIVDVGLTGTDLPSYWADPASVDLGYVGELSSRSSVVTIHNDGADPLVVTGVALVDEDADNHLDYSVTSQTCTATPVGSSGTCSVTVRYAPTAQIPDNAALIISGLSPLPAEGGLQVDFHAVGMNYVFPGSFGGELIASPSYTWSSGMALARTAPTGGGQFLHLVTMTDRVGGKWV